MIRITIYLFGLFFVINNVYTMENQRDSLKLNYNDTTKFVVKEKDSITYIFGKNTFALSIKDSAISLCDNAIRKCLTIIGETNFTTKYRIHFIDSEDEMEKYTGWRTAGGYVEHDNNIVYISFRKDEIGPITHELMHMISMSAWGKQPKSSTWMNEGLSTYAANYCSGYTVEELYRFFLSKNMLFSMDSLSSNFRKYKDMISYHQSAFIVQYLMENFSLEKFKELWQAGFQDFDKIYGFSFEKLENDIKVYLNNKYPVPQDIDWDIVGKGCELINLKEKSK
ncbi:MAG: peptidase MA family metallohydrolase [bacterium]